MIDQLSETALTELVRRFYAEARLDPVLGPVFDAAVTDWDAHVAKVAAFWASVLLGARTYRGNPLAEHAKHPLEADMFARWLRIWSKTVDALFVPDVAIQLKVRATMMAESLKLGLFGLPELGRAP